MVNNRIIQSIVDEYKKSIIITEQEVRSKLLVPVIEALGYEAKYRAEEFPIYGFEGRKRLPTKEADYILFNDTDFNHHRGYNQKDIEWVQNHSLLIVEAKRPNALPDVNGQVQYYAMWTRTLAYMVSDGIIIRGFYHSIGTADVELFSFAIDEVDLWTDKIKELSMELLCDLKQKVKNIYFNNFPGTCHADDGIYTDSSLLSKNREKYSLDKIVQFERNRQSIAKIYLDNDIMPTFQGKMFTDEKSGNGVLFESELIDIYIGFGLIILPYYHVLSKSVDVRLTDFKKVIKFFKARRIRIVSERDNGYEFAFSNQYHDTEKEINYWIEELTKMKEIEIYYDIHFRLEWLEGETEIFKTYQAVDFVYDGIIMQNNCYKIIETTKRPPRLRNVIEPLVIDEGDIQINELKIHGITFVPYRVSIIPRKKKIQSYYKKGLLCLPCCCTCVIDKA